MGKSPLWFFVPTFDGTIHAFLQIGFALVFLAAVLVTPRLVSRSARAESWARRRAAIEGDGDTVPTYSTAEELSGAVASPAERWADVLPSLLLVFGLLGTFIGLGLALTEAAGVLGGGNDALSGLTPIMDSLGSKFKTSTWGILAFLSLKVYFILHPYEEQRLAWAAQQLKASAAHAAATEQQLAAAERQRLIDTIARSGAAVLEQQQLDAREAAERHAASLGALSQFADQQAHIGDKQLHALDAVLGQLSTAGEQRRAMAEQLNAAGEQDKALATQLAASAEHQAAQVASQLLLLTEVNQHTQANRQAMEGFVGSVRENIATMATAADNMGSAALAAGAASADLGDAIGEFRGTMIDVLQQIRTGLDGSINDMQQSFSTNMQAMSASLTRATDGIEDAIAHLSTGVSDTITKLDQANSQAIIRQDKAQAAFRASGDEVAASIITMQSFVDEMQKKTEVGLSSVATAGQRMALASQQIMNFEAKFTEQNALLHQVVSSLQQLGGDIGKLVESINDHTRTDALHQEQRTDLARLITKIDALGAAINGLAAEQHRAEPEVV